jgi:hypothetical protein
MRSVFMSMAVLAGGEWNPVRSLRRAGRYECHCGTVLDILLVNDPTVVIHATSGEPNERSELRRSRDSPLRSLGPAGFGAVKLTRPHVRGVTA